MWDLQAKLLVYWWILETFEKRYVGRSHTLTVYQDRFWKCCYFRPPGPRSWDRTVESRYDQNASQPTVYESTARTSAPQPVEGAVIWTMVIMLYSIHIPLDSLDSLDSIFQGKPGGATNNEGFPMISSKALLWIFVLVAQFLTQLCFFNGQTAKGSNTKGFFNQWFLQSWWDQESMPFLTVFATQQKW